MKKVNGAFRTAERLKEKESLTYILVTHEKELVYDMLDMDYRAEMRNGRLEYV